MARPAKKPISKKKPKVLAYDLGGTKVSVGVIDSSGKILASHREPVLISQGKKATIDQLARLGLEMIKQFPDIEVAGIASAGPLDPEKGELLDPTNFKGPDGPWGRTPITSILKKRLKVEVVLENDAASALLAESWQGLAKKFRNSMILTLGTGLGTAFICNGRLVRGGNNSHTEAGHMVIVQGDDSALCGCGNYGCAEAYLSGKFFAHRARKKLKNEQIDAVQIAARARRGEKAALALFEDYADHMATTLHNCYRIFGPEVVILTGSFAAANDLFIPQTQEKLRYLMRRYLDLTGPLPEIQVSTLENQAGLLGGAYIALQKIGAL